MKELERLLQEYADRGWYERPVEEEIAIEQGLEREGWSEEAMYPTWREPLHSLYNQPAFACGQCDHVAKDFTLFARTRGWKAANNYREELIQEPFQSIFEPDVSDNHFLASADALGYGDQPGSEFGFHDYHTLTLLRYQGEIYSIDWSAAQYGYHHFPLLQRLESAAEIGGYPNWHRLEIPPMIPSIEAVTPSYALETEINAGHDLIN
jgi:hypothetical protein